MRRSKESGEGFLGATRRGSTAWPGVLGHCWDGRCGKNNRFVTVYSSGKDVGTYPTMGSLIIEQPVWASFENIANKSFIAEEGSDHTLVGWKRG